MEMKLPFALVLPVIVITPPKLSLLYYRCIRFTSIPTKKDSETFYAGIHITNC
jgi:hypothetical protein